MDAKVGLLYEHALRRIRTIFVAYLRYHNMKKLGYFLLLLPLLFAFGKNKKPQHSKYLTKHYVKVPAGKVYTNLEAALINTRRARAGRGSGAGGGCGVRWGLWMGGGLPRSTRYARRVPEKGGGMGGVFSDFAAAGRGGGMGM